MNKEIFTKQWLPYLKQHWFKLGLGVLVIFVFLKKDFSFQLNLRAPQQIEKGAPQHHTTHKKKEILTDNMDAQLTKNETPIVDKFKMAFWGDSDQTSKNYQEFMELSDEVNEAYMKRFAHVAVTEYQKFGIPASIILSNALLKSLGGGRALATSSNNHFALPCTNSWEGKEINYEGKCYRSYSSAWNSFRDHSLFLTTGKYESLQKIGSKDYKAWARALGKTELADSGNYAKNLITIIEKYQLNQLDE